MKIHRDTGTEYDKGGFNEDRIHRDTGTEYDKGGIRSDGYDRNNPDHNDLIEEDSEVFEDVKLDYDLVVDEKDIDTK